MKKQSVKNQAHLMIQLSNCCGGILSFTFWMSNSFTSYSEGMDARICTCGKIAAYLCVD